MSVLTTYDISTDTMREVTQADVVRWEKVHRAYGQIRGLVAVYDAATEPLEEDDVLKSLLQELNNVHQELKSRLEAPARGPD